MAGSYILQKHNFDQIYALLGQYSDWGLEAADIVGPPRRFWADQTSVEPAVEVGLELTSLRAVPSPASLLLHLPTGDSWPAQGKRSLARLQAYFLITEDPQRRLDSREVETLSHQVSLVQHILRNGDLRRVLIADEVGLGKTVEVGLIIRELLAQKPGLRVLYLAPARLVSNVRSEFERLGLSFRQWSAEEADGRLTDSRLIASIHRAVHGNNLDRVMATIPWDIIVVDECHHLSAWENGGGKSSEAYRLVKELIIRQDSESRVILMSGTPHQGHQTRFENLLDLLRAPGEDESTLSGRVIYRTKDDIRDWEGNPVFPNRLVRDPLVIDLGDAHRAWMRDIHDFYKPPCDWRSGQSRRRAAGWRCAQAMQWAASSPHAGLGYLTRQAIRANWSPTNLILRSALSELRPYRLGSVNEHLDELYRRISQEVERQELSDDVDDIEDYIPGDARDRESQRGLEALIAQGVELVKHFGDQKWDIIRHHLLEPAGEEKVVLFAQPIETVTALARYLKRQTGKEPAIIIGGQEDSKRRHEVERFRRLDGAQFLISSRAGGEGLNLQVARRLIHIDVPWNPMDMEQRVGRVHRFGSKETIIVDTVVVQDSREAVAYQIARDKLKLITKTLVEAERFETVFGRVMTLLSQDEFQDILIRQPEAPFSESDQDRLASMVQKGFHRWKEFHDQYGKQKSIENQTPGLAAWEDALLFAEQHAGASRRNGHKLLRFRRDGEAVKCVEAEADVIAFPDGRTYVCNEYPECLVYGPGGQVTPKLGLNLSPIATAMRRVALPSTYSGAAWLKWPLSVPLSPAFGSLPCGVLAFVRQTVRREISGAWSELGQSLHLFVVNQGRSVEIQGHDKRDLFRCLFQAAVCKTLDSDSEMPGTLVELESKMIGALRQPSTDERKVGIRHSVLPVFAAVITI